MAHDPLDAVEQVRDELEQLEQTGFSVRDLTNRFAETSHDRGFPAEDFWRSLESLQRDPGWPYDEPDDLPSILAALPVSEPEVVEVDDLEDRLLGAWQGRIAGCNVGKPVEDGFRWSRASLREYLGLPAPIRCATTCPRSTRCRRDSPCARTTGAAPREATSTARRETTTSITRSWRSTCWRRIRRRSPGPTSQRRGWSCRRRAGIHGGASHLSQPAAGSFPRPRGGVPQPVPGVDRRTDPWRRLRVRQPWSAPLGSRSRLSGRVAVPPCERHLRGDVVRGPRRCRVLGSHPRCGRRDVAATDPAAVAPAPGRVSGGVGPRAWALLGGDAGGRRSSLGRLQLGPHDQQRRGDHRGTPVLRRGPRHGHRAHGHGRTGHRFQRGHRRIGPWGVRRCLRPALALGRSAEGPGPLRPLRFRPPPNQ